jgi:hypothetical protein
MRTFISPRQEEGTDFRRVRSRSGLRFPSKRIKAHLHPTRGSRVDCGQTERPERLEITYVRPGRGTPPVCPLLAKERHRRCGDCISTRTPDRGGLAMVKKGGGIEDVECNRCNSQRRNRVRTRSVYMTKPDVASSGFATFGDGNVSRGRRSFPKRAISFFGPFQERATRSTATDNLRRHFQLSPHQ